MLDFDPHIKNIKKYQIEKTTKPGLQCLEVNKIVCIKFKFIFIQHTYTSSLNERI